MSLAALLLLPLATWAGQGQGTPSIEVKSTVELEMEREITIGDVTEFQGFEESELAEIKSVRIGEAPAGREERIFTDQDLSQTFRAHLPSLQAKKEERIRLMIPSQLVVTRKAPRLEAKAVEAELIRQMSVYCEGCEIEIPQLNLPVVPKKELESGRWSLRLRPELPKGSFSVPLEITGNATRRLYWVTGDVRIWKQVPVAKRTISIGERLSADHFRVERRDVTYLNDSYPSLEELEEAVAARTIAAEGPIGRSVIRREQAIKYGQGVKVVMGNEAWHVSAEGVSQQGGYIGDLVKVKIQSTNKVVSGILKEKGLVEVR